MFGEILGLLSAFACRVLSADVSYVFKYLTILMCMFLKINKDYRNYAHIDMSISVWLKSHCNLPFV